MTSLSHQHTTTAAERITGALVVGLFGAVVVLNTASAMFTLLST